MKFVLEHHIYQVGERDVPQTIEEVIAQARSRHALFPNGPDAMKSAIRHQSINWLDDQAIAYELTLIDRETARFSYTFSDEQGVYRIKILLIDIPNEADEIMFSLRWGEDFR